LSFVEWLVSFVLTNIKQLVLPGLYAIPSMMDNSSNQVLLGMICLGLVGIIVLSALLASRRKTKKTIQAGAPESDVPADHPAASDQLPVETQPAPPDIESPPAPGIQPPKEKVSDEQISVILKSGIALVRDGDYATGEQMFRKVIEYRPEEPKAWLWLGYLLGRKKEYRAAERCFKLAQKFGHPKAEEALIWLDAQKS
jgi:TolA-binding protein